MMRHNGENDEDEYDINHEYIDYIDIDSNSNDRALKLQTANKPITLIHHDRIVPGVSLSGSFTNRD